jgi:hypothetical protein
VSPTSLPTFYLFYSPFLPSCFVILLVLSTFLLCFIRCFSLRFFSFRYVFSLFLLAIFRSVLLFFLLLFGYTTSHISLCFPFFFGLAFILNISIYFCYSCFISCFVYLFAFIFSCLCLYCQWLTILIMYFTLFSFMNSFVFLSLSSNQVMLCFRNFLNKDLEAGSFNFKFFVQNHKNRNNKYYFSQGFFISTMKRNISYELKKSITSKHFHLGNLNWNISEKKSRKLLKCLLYLIIVFLITFFLFAKNLEQKITIHQVFLL